MLFLVLITGRSCSPKDLLVSAAVALGQSASKGAWQTSLPLNSVAHAGRRDLYNCKVLPRLSRRVNHPLTKNSLKNRIPSVIPDGNGLVA